MENMDILANRIKAWVESDPELDVLTFVSVSKTGVLEDETRTYRQLWENAQRLAAWLRSKGMQKGDAFALVMANHPQFVELMVASSILGTIFVPIDPRTRGDKLRYMLDFAQCKGAVVAPYALDNVNAVWGDQGGWVLPFSGETGDTVETILQGPLPDPLLEVASTDENAPMQMLYTSGTTGDPKAIMSSHARFAIGATVAGILGINKDDRPYTGLSLTHANAQIVTLGSILLLGLRGVISVKFTKSRLWDITRQYGCTWFNLLGGMTTAIYAEPPRDNDRDNPVRIVLSAGMPGVIWEEFAQRFDVKIFEFYGAAEGGLTFNPAGAGPVGSCGKAPANLELKILAEGDRECAPGEAGEICFRNADGTAPEVEYFQKPEASAEKTRDGWLRMGDIGHVDENGWLYFHYRKGGGIRRNGDFIQPAFVEKALSNLPVVDDVFVYGVPAANGAPGEKDVVAAIVLNPAEPFDADDVFSACRGSLDSNAVPCYLQVVREIPKTASEKPQERLLLEAFDEKADNIYREMALV